MDIFYYQFTKMNFAYKIIENELLVLSIRSITNLVCNRQIALDCIRGEVYARCMSHLEAGRGVMCKRGCERGQHAQARSRLNARKPRRDRMRGSLTRRGPTRGYKRGGGSLGEIEGEVQEVTGEVGLNMVLRAYQARFRSRAELCVSHVQHVPHTVLGV